MTRAKVSLSVSKRNFNTAVWRHLTTMAMIMIMAIPKWLRLCLMALVIGLVHHVSAKSQSPYIAQMSASEVEHALQVCVSHVI